MGKRSKAHRHHLTEPLAAARQLGRRAGRAARQRLPRLGKGPPGTPAGIEHEQLKQMAAAAEEVRLQVTDYSSLRVERRRIEDLDEFLRHDRPDWATVRWLNVDGLSNLAALHAIADRYRLHPLAIEDVLHVPQRPKLDTFNHGDGRLARLFTIIPMLTLEQGHLQREQIALFLSQHTVITIQEGAPGDVWDPIRRRLEGTDERLRGNDASFLFYALIDAVVDQCFPILEHYGSRLEDLEESLLAQFDQTVIRQVYEVRRELLLFRRELWPLREVISALAREPHEHLGENARLYFRDVHDHTVQIIDLIETYREFSSGLAETYLTVMGNRMNEVMKVLTVFASIFIPITFLAGVYGMNFDYLPELDWTWAYPVFWVICLAQTAGMLVWFRRKGWL